MIFPSASNSGLDWKDIPEDQWRSRSSLSLLILLRNLSIQELGARLQQPGGELRSRGWPHHEGSERSRRMNSKRSSSNCSRSCSTGNEGKAYHEKTWRYLQTHVRYNDPLNKCRDNITQTKYLLVVAHSYRRRKETQRLRNELTHWVNIAQGNLMRTPTVSSVQPMCLPDPTSSQTLLTKA
jgi:hypothetical protein